MACYQDYLRGLLDLTDVTLRSARRADAAAGAQLTVTTNSPFTLTVKVAGLTCTRVLAGNTTFDCGTFR